MNWFVYYNGGSCNEGDHSVDLVAFNTRLAAVAFIEDLDYENKESARLIHGEEDFDFTKQVTH